MTYFQIYLDDFQYASDSAIQASWPASPLIDANNPTIEDESPLEGSKSGSFSWTNFSGIATWTASLSSQDLDSLVVSSANVPTRGFLVIKFQLTDYTSVSSLSIRLGSDSSNYITYSYTPESNNNTQLAVIDLTGGTKTSSPDWTAIDYFQITVNESASSDITISSLKVLKNYPTFLNTQYRFTNEDTSETLDLSDIDNKTNTSILYKTPAGLTSPPIRQDEIFKSSADGIRTGDPYLGKRVITFETTLSTSTLQQMNEMITQYRKVLVPVQDKGYNKTLHNLTFTDVDTYEKEISYEIESIPEFAKSVDIQTEVIGTFAIKCNDPVFYGTKEYTETLSSVTITGGLQVPAQVPAQLATQSVGGVYIMNNGNYKYVPTITITGACENPIVYNVTTGKQLKYDVTMIATDIISCNNLTGETTKNGADNTGELEDDSEFIELIPGLNYILFSDDTVSATAECQIVHKSAWI